MRFLRVHRIVSWLSGVPMRVVVRQRYEARTVRKASTVSKQEPKSYRTHQFLFLLRKTEVGQEIDQQNEQEERGQ